MGRSQRCYQHRVTTATLKEGHMPKGHYIRQERRPLIDRFLEKIQRHENGCWIFTGCLATTGYGKMSSSGPNRKSEYAHRISYELYNGLIPEGMEIDHLCRNRQCVNPEHLEVVTSALNMQRAAPYMILNPGNRGIHEKSKTHCPHGHEYSLENTYLDPRNGNRHCKACRKSRGER